MKSIRLPLAAIFFMTCFCRVVGGGPWPSWPSWPPGSASAVSRVLIDSS